MTAPFALSPTPPGRPAGGVRTIAEFTDYADAQRLVDRLSDRGFPVERTRIVGSGLESVEQVTGRMTTGRAALAGAASGAWFGLLVGLLLAVFSTTGSGFLGILLTALLIGALWGGAFGFVGHWATRGQRDFSSVRVLRATHYAVQVDDEVADDAIREGGLIQ